MIRFDINRCGAEPGLMLGSAYIKTFGFVQTFRVPTAIINLMIIRYCQKLLPICLNAMTKYPMNPALSIVALVECVRSSTLSETLPKLKSSHGGVELFYSIMAVLRVLKFPPIHHRCSVGDERIESHFTNEYVQMHPPSRVPEEDPSSPNGVSRFC